MAQKKKPGSGRPEPAPVPGDSSRPKVFPIVGIGASAGGLEAVTTLLEALPSNTGMAFVIVQHLAPRHASALTEILSKATSMSVRDIQNGMLVEPDTIYVITPASDLGIEKG